MITLCVDGGTFAASVTLWNTWIFALKIILSLCSGGGIGVKVPYSRVSTPATPVSMSRTGTECGLCLMKIYCKIVSIFRARVIGRMSCATDKY